MLSEIEASFFFSFPNRVYHLINHTKYKRAWMQKEITTFQKLKIFTESESHRA